MKGRGRALVYAAAACLSLLLLGFLVFAALATRPAPVAPNAADGIIVLTGGTERRIVEGVRLLKAGYAPRLLISGVNHTINRNVLLARYDAETACCVDLGYRAQDTIGNAAEARDWAARHGFNRLIVVTSSYHMPRSLAELAIAMPHAHLAAHPVLPLGLSQGGWWLRPSAARMLATEYLKLLSTYVRYAADSIVKPLARPIETTSPDSRQTACQPGPCP